MTAVGLPSGASATPAFKAVCPSTRPGIMRCFAIARVDGRGHILRFANPSGYGPSDLQSAYKLPSGSQGTGQTVAIIDAFGYPNAESDLAAYRSQYHLPACTSQNGCFTKIDEYGGTHYPPTNGSWDVEQALDVDMVSAICPNCRILLVEANTSGFANGTDLYIAENQAALPKWGVNAMSNSWGSPEYAGEVTDNAAFNHPGIAITAATGDWSYSFGPIFPSTSQYVTAVGGTTLQRGGGSRGWTETAWGGAGSGCSAYSPQPSWQNLQDPTCPRGGPGKGTGRIAADVAAVADPSTGVAIYIGGWGEVGGTSVASPIIASVYALAGNTGSITYGSYPYSHTSALYDITSGSTGSCSPSYLCNAGPGYDGPTGLGTPNGTGGF